MLPLGIEGAVEGVAVPERHRESALIVFLVTLSGVSFVGVSSAFWGVLAGALALFVQQWRFRSQRASPL